MLLKYFDMAKQGLTSGKKVVFLLNQVKLKKIMQIYALPAQITAKSTILRSKNGKKSSYC